MPKFLFNKLVRDKLPEEYTRLSQKAEYMTLSTQQHSEALVQKIIEEASEIPSGGTKDEIIAEIADVQQALDDLRQLHTITANQVATVQQKKFAKKGGFNDAVYVTTIELRDDDDWVAYYRDNSDRYPEVDNNSVRTYHDTIKP